jgi:sigma-E factor negative regulatory protein RseA
MTEAHQENLSAGMDGELSKEELRFLLRRLDHDAALLDAWARCHVARAGLRRELPALASSGFAARVMLAIETEAAVPASAHAARHAGGRRRHWLHWSAGGAIAAGVAVAALMVAQPTTDSDVRGSAPQVASVPAPAAPQRQVAELSPRPSSGAVAPAAVPPWLSANTASQFSERASMTLGDPSSDPMRPYRVRGYRTLNAGDGSYLLLVDPGQAANNGRVPQAAVAQ